MNDLESSIYSLRDAISGRLSDFLVEASKEKLGSKLTAMEDWLYDEGMDAEKGVYEDKLKELRTAFAAGELHASEASARPEAFDALAQAIEKFSSFAASQSEEFAHIGTEEKQKVASECAQAQTYMAETKAKLDALEKTAEPSIKAAEITAKANALSAVCTPIMNTPKPLPMEPEPAPSAEVPADAATDGAAAEPAAEGGESAE